MKIGFLGVGLMGKPMVRNLAAAGHDVVVWSRSEESRAAVADVASTSAMPAGAAVDCDVVIAMLADGPVTESVLTQQGVIEAAKGGAIIINMGSVEPDRDRRLADVASGHGLSYLDAPVSGGVPGAEAAKLVIMAGGDAQAFERARPVFDALGRATHVGPSGAGQTVKLANQLIVGATIGAVAEAFKLAESAGCNPEIVREALSGGFADSRILQVHGVRMGTRNFVPGGKSATQLKDMRNIIAAAEAAGLNLPIAATARDAYADFVDNHDGGGLDHSAYYLWLERSGRAKP